MAETSKHHQKNMKAVRWEEKPFSVSVRNIPIPKILHPQDAIIRITSSAVCGTDLHFYNGRYTMPTETVGHENMGIVEEVGDDVSVIKKGDRVVVNCDIEEPFDNGNDEDRGTFGFGPIPPLNLLHQGGQAEYMRVPWATHNLIVIPPGKKNELDYLLLADIWPTAWWALDCADQVIGDTVVVFGAGPVGLLCAYSAFLRGASKVYVVDRITERLEKAKSLGAIPINFAEVDPVKEILKYEPSGVDRSCECVGYECVDAKGKNVENITIKWAIGVTRPYGGIGLIGVFLPAGPDPKDTDGVTDFPIGDFFVKSLSLKGGMVDTRRFQNTLQILIESGKAKPSFVFDKKFNIKDANKAYKNFADRKIIKAYFSFNDRDDENSSDSSDSSRSPSDDEKNGHGKNGNGRHRRDGSKSRDGKRARRDSSVGSPARDSKVRKVQRNGYGRGRPIYRF